ncbi:hypothetical protein XENTR_v10019009 [Xenopus tropicalis]|nr:hypothetical protein XENTR_v10019009 [Xenopus tropicalis]
MVFQFPYLYLDVEYLVAVQLHHKPFCQFVLCLCPSPRLTARVMLSLQTHWCGLITEGVKKLLLVAAT